MPITNDTWDQLKPWLPRPPVLVGWLLLIAVAIWTYHYPIWSLHHTWSTEDDYGHCYFVPVFALFLLWWRREMVDPWPQQGSWWCVPFLLIWAAMRLTSVYFNYPLFDKASIIFCVAGMTLLLGGRQAMRWAWPSIAFLVFMLPLPGALAVSLSHPLQRLATVISVHIIQMLGIPAAAYGNVIELTDSKLEVARACSGLRMLTLFFAVCVGAAFIMKGPIWEKLVIVFSAIPIALVSNASRIVLTAIQREVYSTEEIDEWMHNVAGYAMMPLAMLLTFGVIILLQKMFPPEPDELPLTDKAEVVEVPAQPQVRRPVRAPRPPRPPAPLTRHRGTRSGG